MPSIRLTTILISVPVLLLAACEGYEPAPYDGFPYNNERTAGTGIAYVRANMAPPRGPVVEPAPKAEVAPAPQPEPEPEPIQQTRDILDTIDEDAERLFNEGQRK